MNSSNPGLSSFGCLSLNAILAAGVVVLLVVGFSLAQGGALFSPGALNAQVGAPPLGGVASHAEITRCEQCHPVPFSGGSMAGACLACHTDVSQDPKNFHTLMVTQGQSSDCHTCHTEHRGAAAALTKEVIGEFPHNQLGFSLLAHQKMADGSPFRCSDCHPETYGRFSPGVCASCHTLTQPEFMAGHSAVFGQDCRACHDGLDSFGHDFDHQQAAFPLAGKHAALTCEKCHTSARTLADLKAAPQTCAGCHPDPAYHRGLLGTACAGCHTTDAWTPARFNLAHTFPIGHERSDNTCRTCHPANLNQYTCTQCHSQASMEKEHRNRGDISNCIRCHANGEKGEEGD